MHNQDAKKAGNSHSSLVQVLLDASNKKSDAPKIEFRDLIKTAFKKPTVKDIISKVKMAQIDSMGDSMPPTSGESPLGSSEPTDPSVDSGLGGDTESAKRHLAEAFVALCGSPEEAKNCIDSLTTEGSPGELGDEELGAPEGGMLDRPSNMPAPMEMPAPMPM